MLPELVSIAGVSGKLLIKVDTEGGEAAILNHSDSNNIIRNSDYCTMEMHWWSSTGTEGTAAVIDRINWIDSFRDSHIVKTYYHYGGGMVWMRKRN